MRKIQFQSNLLAQLTFCVLTKQARSSKQSRQCCSSAVLFQQCTIQSACHSFVHFDQVLSMHKSQKHTSRRDNCKLGFAKECLFKVFFCACILNQLLWCFKKLPLEKKGKHKCRMPSKRFGQDSWMFFWGCLSHFVATAC